MNRQKTLQLMQLMAQNVISYQSFQCDLSLLSIRFHTSEPHLSLREKVIAGLTG